MAARLACLVLAAVVVVIDLVTKNWAVAALAGAPPIELTSFLRLVYVENSGVAFGLFADGGAFARWFLVGMTLVISVVILGFLWHAASRWEMTAAALMLGGALGNIYDRVRYGYVVDFIDAYWREHHFPAFNVADASVCAGAFLFVCVLLKGVGAADPPIAVGGSDSKDCY